MDVIFPTCCGVDVHKNFIVAVIVKTTNSVKPQYFKKRFSTYHNQLVEFRNWLVENECDNVCMESTGKYYIPIYNILEGVISNVEVVNPKWLKMIKGQKDDNKDAKWIADLFRVGLTKPSFIPSKDIRVLRELTRYRFKQVNNRSSEKNRFQNALTVGNCNIDQAFTNVFGKTASLIVDSILAQDEIDYEYIDSIRHKSCKSTTEQILQAIEGTSLTPEQLKRMVFIKEHMLYIDDTISRLDELIDEVVQPYNHFIELMCTIPGMDRRSAINTLSEIGINMEQFGNQFRITSWGGLAPGRNESAGKKKSVKISRAGIYLKPCLVQVAHAAVKDKSNPYYAKKYEKIAKRRGKKRAIIAIARKILVAVFHIISKQVPFNPVDAYDYETSKEKRLTLAKKDFLSSAKQLLANDIEIADLLKQVYKQ